MSLTQDLESLKTESTGRLPPNALALFDNLIRDLKARNFAQTALRIGDHIPSFELPDAVGRKVSSSELLDSGPVVICFYRGAWCPFCNLELKALQASLQDITALGAQLVAISPMTPDNSLSLVEKHHLDFAVLSDSGLKVASDFGLSYQIPPDLQSFLQKAGVDLERYNGDSSWKLPVPATYVADRNGIVVAAVNPDWRERLDPVEIVAALGKLA